MRLVEVQGVGRRLARVGWAAAAAAILATGAVMATSMPTAGRDAAAGIVAGEQILQGRQATLTDMRVADPADLSRDVLWRIGWWPPGQQIVVHALRRLGLPLGRAMHALVAGAWLIGLVGWILWFRHALARQPALLPWLVAAFALFRMTHIGAFVHLGGDTIVWGVLPWVAVLQVAAIRRGSSAAGLAVVFVAGALATWLIVVKYTVVFLAAGIGAAWAWSWHRRDITLAQLSAWSLGAIVGSAAAWITGLGTALAGRTPADSWCVHPTATVAAWAIGGPVMGLNDAEGLIGALMSDGTVAAHDIYVAAASLASAALVGAWLWSVRDQAQLDAAEMPRSARLAVRIGVLCCVITTAGLTVLMLKKGCISWEGRHQQYGALLLMPFAVALGARTLRAHASTAARALTIAAGLATVGLATAYGTGGLIKKTRAGYGRLPFVTTANGIRLDFPFSAGGAAAFEREFRALPRIDQAVIHTSITNLPLAFPEFRYTSPDVRPGERGRPPGGVYIINFPENALPEAALRRMFADIQTWTPITLSSVPAFDVWQGK